MAGAAGPRMRSRAVWVIAVTVAVVAAACGGKGGAPCRPGAVKAIGGDGPSGGTAAGGCSPRTKD